MNRILDFASWQLLGEMRKHSNELAEAIGNVVLIAMVWRSEEVRSDLLIAAQWKQDDYNPFRDINSALYSLIDPEIVRKSIDLLVPLWPADPTVVTLLKAASESRWSDTEGNVIPLAPFPDINGIPIDQVHIIYPDRGAIEQYTHPPLAA